MLANGTPINSDGAALVRLVVPVIEGFVAFNEIKAASGGVAELRRLCYHHIQHRLQIAARAVDDLQHLGGRGLLRDGLGELALKVGDDLLGISCGIVRSHN